MSEFESMMQDGFAAVVAVCDGAVISTGAGPTLKVRSCIIGNPTVSRELQATGLRLNYDTVAELTRADAEYLGLYPMESNTDRPTCTINGRTYKRDGIEDDPHDPMVRLQLITQRKSPAA